MSTERVAILNLLIFIFFYFFTLNMKKKIISCLILLIFTIILNYSFGNYFTKFYKSTYDQIYEKEIVTNSPFKDYKENHYSKRPLYFSRNHENMFLTSIEIFKDNIFFGTGIKTFREECKKEKYKLEQRCSTHPHNTYAQLLSETGIFSFLIIFFVFLIYVFEILKIIFTNKMTKHNKIILVSNIGIFIHLVPLIPAGSFYNNWMSCIFFLNLAINLYLKNNLKKLIFK
ncbi:O-antigen ligase family protein [Candidatus Pelagibacter sp.]|nr:O-antigen ligase family protein [Candidatus Pelagibacter sp.]